MGMFNSVYVYKPVNKQASSVFSAGVKSRVSAKRLKSKKMWNAMRTLMMFLKQSAPRLPQSGKPILRCVKERWRKRIIVRGVNGGSSVNNIGNTE